MKRRNLKPGAMVYVHWNDITSDPLGPPSKAEVTRKRTLGHFVGYKKDKGLECLILSGTVEPDTNTFEGYDAFPLGCVTKIELIAVRSARRRSRSTSGTRRPTTTASSAATTAGPNAGRDASGATAVWITGSGVPR